MRKYDVEAGQYRASGKYDGNDRATAAGGMNALAPATLNVHDEQFIKQADAYMEFIRTHGRRPTSYAEELEERRLSSWIRGSRSDLRAGKFDVKPWRAALLAEVEALNTATPTRLQDTNSDAFSESFNELKSFRAEHGRTPSEYSDDPVEKVLGRRWSMWKWRARRGEVDNTERLQEIIDYAKFVGEPHPLHAPNYSTWESRALEYQQFLVDRGRRPSREAKNGFENSLALWWGKSNVQRKAGDFDDKPHRLDTMDEIAGFREAVHPTRKNALTEVQEFVATHGRLPRQGADFLLERSISTRFARAKTKARRGGEGTDELVEVLDRIDPHWRDPREARFLKTAQAYLAFLHRGTTPSFTYDRPLWLWWRDVRTGRTPVNTPARRAAVAEIEALRATMSG